MFGRVVTLGTSSKKLYNLLYRTLALVSFWYEKQDLSQCSCDISFGTCLMFSVKLSPADPVFYPWHQFRYSLGYSITDRRILCLFEAGAL